MLPEGVHPPRERGEAPDLVLIVLAGQVDVSAGDAGRGPVGPGEVVVCPRSRPWEIRSCSDEVTLLALAVPAGPEAVLRALAQTPRIDDATLLCLAVDEGVELLLDPLDGGRTEAVGRHADPRPPHGGQPARKSSRSSLNCCS